MFLIAAIIFAIIFIGIIGGIILTYLNMLKKCSQANAMLKEILFGIKKRYDLMPNILAATHKYMTDSDKEQVKLLTKLRTEALNLFNKEAQAEDIINFDKQIIEKMQNLLLISKSYPELNTNEKFLATCADYNDLVEAGLTAKKEYNNEIENWSSELKRFPSSVAKSMFKVETNFAQVNIENDITSIEEIASDKDDINGNENDSATEAENPNEEIVDGDTDTDTDNNENNDIAEDNADEREE